MATQSFVWAWFHVDDKSDTVAQWLICKKIKRGRDGKGKKSFSTSPLHIHMKTHHQEEYNRGKKESELVSPAISSNQPKEKKIVAMKNQLSLQDSLTSKKIRDV